MEMTPKLPNGWRERTIWNPRPGNTAGPRTEGVLAWYSSALRIIEYYPRWWLAPVWWFLVQPITRHERGHAWGLKDCVAGRRWCVMYEGNDDLGWWEKLKALPWKVLGCGDYCPECDAELAQAGAFDR